MFNFTMSKIFTVCDLYREIAEQLLAIFQAQPTLLVDHSKEITEFLINLRTLKSGGKDCYTHLVSDYLHEDGLFGVMGGCHMSLPTK